MVSPWSTVAITSDDLFRDAQATFLSTYRNVLGRNAKLPYVMRLGLSSNKRRERYGYAESPPTIDRVDIGQPLTEDAYRYIAYEVKNLTWGKAVGYFEEDLEDLQLGDIRDQVRQLAKRAAAISEEVFFQILTGASSARLLDAIPLAPDGAALHSATDGNGANRFGVAGGNIVTGSGVLTGQAIRDDLWATLEQFKLFQDTEGEPLLSDDIMDRGVTIVAAASNEQVLRQGLMQSRTAIAASTANSNAAVTNTIIESGIPITLWTTQRLTDNDWYVFMNDTAEGPKPVFEQVRRPMRMQDETRDNSERARRYRILSTLLDMRAGYGVNVPYLTCKVNN